MRAAWAIALLLVAGMAAFVPTASADCDKTVGQNAGLVIVEVHSGGGCVDADLYTCTLSRPDPDHPSTPVWECRKVL